MKQNKQTNNKYNLSYNKAKETKSIKEIVGIEDYSYPSIVGYISSIAKTNSYNDQDKIKIINLLLAMRTSYKSITKRTIKRG